MRCISPSLSVKSNTLKFSAMRCGFDENGMAATFCWMSQRSATCAMRAPARLGDGGQHRIVEQPPAPDRTMGDEDQPVLAHRGQQLRLVEIRMIFGLQDGERFGAERDRLVEQPGGEIGDADMAREPGPLGLGQRRHVFAHRDFRIGPVHQQQVDVIDLERGEAFIDRAGKVGGRADFRG